MDLQNQPSNEKLMKLGEVLEAEAKTKITVRKAQR